MLLSSPQQRAVTTAEEIAAAQAAAGRTVPAVEVHAALQNRDWGALEGTPASQVTLLGLHPVGSHCPCQHAICTACRAHVSRLLELGSHTHESAF